MAKAKPHTNPPTKKSEWHYVEGSLALGKLVLASDEKASIVVLKNRIEFDRWCQRENIIPMQDINWKE